MGLLAAALAGCQGPRVHLDQKFGEGEYGIVRTHLQQRVPANVTPTEDGDRRLEKSDRDYILARLRLALVTLADGYPHDADILYEEIYEMLRMQGLNPDRTTMSIFESEGGRIWKGEPFEQALAYHYVGLHYAMQGSWDNTRAALSNAMFHLRDFGTDEDGQPREAEAVVRDAVDADEGEEYFEDYEAVESDFTLGYLMSAVANQQIGRDGEAEEHFSKVLTIDPGLGSLVDELRAGDYNTLLVVDYGMAPRKIATGPDNTVARFVHRGPSDPRPLRVVADGAEHLFPVVCDVNTMARDHRWNSIEDMRRARAEMGRAVQAAGQVVTVVGAASDNTYMQIGGLLMQAGGAAARAAAAADTRQLEYLPQRVYVAPLRVDDPNRPLEVQVVGDARSRFILRGVDGEGRSVQVRYLRLLAGVGTHAQPGPPAWAVSATRYYSDPDGQADVGPNLPYILGGRCVRPPSAEVLASYQRDGFLEGLTLTDLRVLYELEGIEVDYERGTYPGRHVLEGGDTLVTPARGTMGYARLFYREHPPYEPGSLEVRELAEHVRQQLNPAPEAATLAGP